MTVFDLTKTVCSRDFLLILDQEISKSAAEGNCEVVILNLSVVRAVGRRSYRLLNQLELCLVALEASS